MFYYVFCDIHVVYIFDIHVMFYDVFFPCAFVLSFSNVSIYVSLIIHIVFVRFSIVFSSYLSSIHVMFFY
jgi:hypothetical protein